MNKKINKIFILLAIVLLAAVGCQGVSAPKDAQDLIIKSQKEVEKKKSFTADYTTDIKINIMGQEIGTKAVGDIKQIMQNSLSEMNMSMTVTGSSIGAETPSMNMKMFTEQDPENENQLITYSNVSNSWSKQVQDISQLKGKNLSDNTIKILEENKEAFTLEEETQEINGKESYLITGTLPAATVNSMIENSPFESQNIKFNEDMEVKGQYFFDKETLLPNQVLINVPNMKMAIELGVEGMEAQSMEMNMDMIMNYTGFDNVDPIVIPDEAKNAEITQ